VGLVLVTALAVHCHRPEGSQSGSIPKHPDSATSPQAGQPAAAQPPVRVITEAEAVRPRDDLPADARALLVVNGAERWVDAQAIESVGYTLVDLRDTWTPSIFAEEKTPEGLPLPNRYRRVFIGLANDQLDADGEPLKPGEKNYLELYGVFPSLSVLRSRFSQDAAQPCHDQESVAVLAAVETVSYVPPKRVKHEDKRIADLRPWPPSRSGSPAKTCFRRRAST
jgi:hypothetical protein